MSEERGKGRWRGECVRSRRGGTLVCLLRVEQGGRRGGVRAAVEIGVSGFREAKEFDRGR